MRQILTHIFIPALIAISALLSCNGRRTAPKKETSFLGGGGPDRTARIILHRGSGPVNPALHSSSNLSVTLDSRERALVCKYRGTAPRDDGPPSPGRGPRFRVIEKSKKIGGALYERLAALAGKIKLEKIERPPRKTMPAGGPVRYVRIYKNSGKIFHINLDKIRQIRGYRFADERQKAELLKLLNKVMGAVAGGHAH